MAEFSKQFRSRMGRDGATRYDRMMERKSREFEEYFCNTLNQEDCEIDGRPEHAVFQDQSQSNNKDLSDDKYLIVPNSTLVDIGSYIKWRDSLWLVFTEEFKTIPTHQQLKIKHVNQQIKWVTDYKTRAISNNGQGWGAYVQNQTLYTLGVEFSGNHIALANGKMMLYLKTTPETNQLTTGKRIFVGGRVFTVEFSDEVSRMGLTNLLLAQDTYNPETDNRELGIADYWLKEEHHGADTDNNTGNDNNDGSENSSTEPEQPIEPDKVEWKIKGSETARLGRTSEYSAVEIDKDGNETPIEVEEWLVEDIEDVPFYILDHDKDGVSLRVKDDYRYVGHQATLMARYNGEIKNIVIRIINKF